MIHDEATKGVLWLALLGSMIGLGQLLLTKDPITTRVVIGRAICSGALGMAAAGVLSFIPSLPYPALMGLAATFASLGTSVLEKLVQRIIGGS